MSEPKSAEERMGIMCEKQNVCLNGWVYMYNFECVRERKKEKERERETHTKKRMKD